MDHYEFYKELYHKENDRKQEVTNSLSIPIAVVTAIAAALYLLATSFPYEVATFCSICFLLLISISSILLLFSIYYLTTAFVDFSKSFEYTGIPYPSQIYNWHKDLIAHYQTYYQVIQAGQPGHEEMADQDLKTYLVNEYVKHINHNMTVNDQKHARIFNSKKYLTFCLIGSILTLIPFIYGFSNKKDEVHKIEVTNFINIKPRSINN